MLKPKTQYQFLILILLFTFSVNAQMDSLWNVWKDSSKPDTARAEAIQYYAWSYLFKDADSAIFYGKQELKFATKRKISKWEGKALNTIGIAWMYKGQYDSSLYYLNKALEVRIARGVKSDIARSYGNIGIIYQEIDNLPKAIEYYMKSLAIKEEMNDSIGIANTCNNIGVLYSKMEEYQLELQYQDRALTIYKALGEKQGVARSSHNIGVVNMLLKNYNSALLNLKYALKISNELNDKHGRANVLLSLGKLYLEKDFVNEELENSSYPPQESFNYINEALAINQELEEPKGIVASLNQLTTYYILNSQFSEAQINAQKSIQIAKEYGYVIHLQEAYYNLYEVYKKTGKHQLALEKYQEYDHLKDSLHSSKNKKHFLRNEIKYQFQQQAIEDSLKSAKNKEIAKIANEKYEAQKAVLAQEKAVKILAIALVVILLISAILILRRYTIIKKQKHIIEEQKRVVDEQKDIVEQVNQEIFDSINYAQRLQEAILPDPVEMKTYFQDFFILNQPKDIVSGDFYWCEKINGVVYIAVADCTGHGVPGAMVSMVCSNALNKAVIEEGISKPGAILDRARELVINHFKKGKNQVKDGMDIALVAMQSEKQSESDDPHSPHSFSLCFAGAHNPLWIIRKSSEELEEIKADKQPIGMFGKSVPFTTHEIKLCEGDQFYLFSDGYADQFGGPSNKKFKTKNFKKLLVAQSDKSLAQQHDILKKTHDDWKSNNEQIDDVCVIGARL